MQREHLDKDDRRYFLLIFFPLLKWNKDYKKVDLYIWAVSEFCIPDIQNQVKLQTNKTKLILPVNGNSECEIVRVITVELSYGMIR